MSAPPSPSVVRRTWRIEGQVQGVGFRPFVWRLAHELGLTGTVRNDARGVTVVAVGQTDVLDVAERRMVDDAPPLARVMSLQCVSEDTACASDGDFRIVESGGADAERGRVTVDVATCDDCLREMRDPTNRRCGHALSNCTNCGPRYTIVQDLPYDRALTTMAPFPMCARCASEYRDPADRRFHAQPTCCPACGPRLRLVDGHGEGLPGAPFAEAAVLLRDGGVLAMKGLGGYHLVVDAACEDAVHRLRHAKQRDAKPFALMAADLDAVAGLVHLSAAGRARLLSPARPIVVAPRLPDAPVAVSVAPGHHRLGAMLPYTPMQHLLFDEGLGPLVMTSANHADDPLWKDDETVIERLGAALDALFVHDRPIERAVDDSIWIDAPRGPVPVRRARGYVPEPLLLPVPATRPGLCVGGELKNTVAIVRGREVVLSQHLGDLGYSLAAERFEQTIDDLGRLYACDPEWIACDAHPDYRSRDYAFRTCERRDLDLVEVQHHHAHLASLLAETGRTEKTIGLVCDGVGYGTDGTAWGGEVLVGDLAAFERVGRLRPLRLPGGDAAAKETGRVALSWLTDALGAEAARAHPAAAVAVPNAARRRAIRQLLALDTHCPTSSGLGRLFDAAAALLGVCTWNRHEAMSGTLLESLAASARDRPDGRDLLDVAPASDAALLEVDHRPLLEALLAQIDAGRPLAETAYFVHAALADGFARAVVTVSAQTGIRAVGLSGGVFANTLLTDLLARQLETEGMEVLLHGQVPPNDGGLAYGQAAVAAARGL